ncbi:proton-coupled amino acid transporter-like protein pathetic [Copidosoma floridanum]|uniref:proton-coupled amino acid transporter-like protein pathetic n=1 Tax=Copidosoma floridanum TaxID=29053 RepID=UPI0006C9A3E3|nr:proton-coupled amino acid transporter-like protein pathetic [Copidosoma floridanum]
METADYNPVDHRSPEQLATSSFAVFFHLIKAAAGSGVLFLPYAFKKTGYLAAILCSIIIGTVCIHTAVLTIRCSQILCKRSRVPALSLAQTAEASFKHGPQVLHKFARAFGIATNILVCGVQVQTTIVYILYVSSSFKQVVEYFTDWGQDIRIYIVVFLPFFCLLAVAPNFSFLTPFSVCGTICLVFGLLVSFGYFLSDFPSPSRLPAFTGFEQLGVFCAVFTFSVYNMSMLMPLENTMREPHTMAVLLAAGMVINVIVYVLFGFLGFNRYEDSCDTIIKNLPLDKIPAQIVKVVVPLSVMFTFGLQYFVLAEVVWPWLAAWIGDKVAYKIGFRIGGVVICALFGIILPHMAPVLSLFSAVGTTTLMVLFPVVIETSTKWNEPENLKRNYMLMKNLLITIIWILTLIFGVRESILDIKHEMQATKSTEPEVCQ